MRHPQIAVIQMWYYKIMSMHDLFGPWSSLLCIFTQILLQGKELGRDLTNNHNILN